MIYTYEDFLPHVPELKKYVKSKIRTDWWKDIVQDTLVYLFIKFDKLIITDLRGLIINTANFFINTYFSKSKTQYIDITETRFMFSMIENINPVFKIGIWNGNNIDDKLYSNLRRVSKTLFSPFEMQMNDMSIREIACKLELNENTVKTRIKRCKDILKQGL